MPYGEFTIDEVKSRFKLRLDEQQEFFADVPPLEVSPLLRDTLAENVPLAVAISTEKARSELIIAPVLLEVRRRAPRKISLFSGIDFTVDPEQGLSDVCDYLLSLSPEQLTVEAPVITVVEAKNDNLKSGLGQCIAEMVATMIYNRQKGTEVDRVFGVVTMGSLWKFMALSGDVVSVDLREYHISEVGRVVGIMVSMIGAAPAQSNRPS